MVLPPFVPSLSLKIYDCWLVHISLVHWQGHILMQIWPWYSAVLPQSVPTPALSAVYCLPWYAPVMAVLPRKGISYWDGHSVFKVRRPAIAA